MLMIFRLEEIGNDRLFFEVSRNGRWLANMAEIAEGGGDTKLLSPVSFSASIEKIGGQLSVSGKLSFELLSPCARCLKPVREDISRGINFVFPVAERGKKIDISDDMREQVAMAMPEKTVCAENCKGLCAYCGENLNDTPCNCEMQGVDPRLKALKEVRLS